MCHRTNTNARKSRATCPGIAWCADRTPVHRRRPAPGPVRAAPAEPLAARPIGASAIDAAAPTGARPGQGRPRGAVRRSRTAASAKKRAKVVQLVLELLGVLIARPCTGVRLDARPGQGRPRGGVWPTAKLPRAQKNTRKSRATCPGIAWCADRTPVHRRPTGRPARSGPPPRRRLANGQTAASAKKHAQKSCNLSWNCLVC